MLVKHDHKRRERHPGKANVDQSEHRIPEEDAPAGDEHEGIQKSDFRGVVFFEKIKNGRGVAEQANQRWDAGSEFVDRAGQVEKSQNYPIVQRWFVIIKLAVERRCNVVAGQLHLQRYERANRFVINESKQAQIDEQRRRQQNDSSNAQPMGNFLFVYGQLTIVYDP